MGVDASGLEALPAQAPAVAPVMEVPLTGSVIPREHYCHQGVARAPPHLIPFEDNRCIMRLLVLSSLCPCSIKALSVQMCCPLIVLPACLRVSCRLYFTYANFKCVRALFTCTIKLHFVYCSDVTSVHQGKTVIKQCTFFEGLIGYDIFIPSWGGQGKCCCIILHSASCQSPNTHNVTLQYLSSHTCSINSYL